MDSLDSAIFGLRHAVDTDNWRWLVRQNLSAVRDALASPPVRSLDGWLVARAESSERLRHDLVERVTEVGSALLERPDPETARAEVHRLVVDLEHFRQRLHDLVYDSVSLELGGSE